MPSHPSSHGTDADADFTPASHVADGHPIDAIVQNIVGDARRQAVREFLTLRQLQPGLDMDARWLADRLPARDRAQWVRRSPLRHLAGEYLPRYRRGEVELARIVVHGHPPIVYSLRAQPMQGGARHRLRMVDEYRTPVHLPFTTHPGRLTLRGVVTLIDGARVPGLEQRTLALPEALLLWRIHLGDDTVPGRTASVRVESVVYPALAQHYGARLEQLLGRFSPGAR